MWGNVGRYREAIDEGRRCIDTLRSAGSVPANELAHAHVELAWRLTKIGETRELLTTTPPLLRQAVESEDTVLATAFHVVSANANLAADRPDEAERHLAEARRWCPVAYEVGRFGWSIATLALLLYRDDVDGALAHTRDEAGVLGKLRLLDLPAVRTIHRYRTGVALAHALMRVRGARARALARELDGIRRDLAAQRFAVAVAHSRLLDASHHVRTGARDRGMGLLREGADRFAALGWNAVSLLARTRYREIQGLPADAAAPEVLARLGVERPACWSRCTLPPFAGTE
jgi:hypothetical protein